MCKMNKRPYIPLKLRENEMCNQNKNTIDNELKYDKWLHAPLNEDLFILFLFYFYDLLLHLLLFGHILGEWVVGFMWERHGNHIVSSRCLNILPLNNHLSNMVFL